MKYSLIMQHTTTKQCWVYNVDDLNDKSNIYYKFNIDLVEGMPEGEYQYVLFENPSWQEVIVDVNHIYPAEWNESILVTFDNILTNNTQILIAGRTRTVSSTGLMRIGDYNNNRYQYDKQQNYVAYERK